MTFASGPIARDPQGQGGILIPPSRLTLFQPGVTYNGVAGNGLGIPNRTTINTTLTPKGSATATITIASPAVLTLAGGLTLNTGDIFVLWTTGALPGGVAQGQQYFALGTGASFQFSASSGGAAINTTGTQSGTHTAFADDTAQIQAAINTCPAGQVVQLGSSGNPTFIITGGGINHKTNNITVRGLGPGPGAAIKSGSIGPATAVGTYTALWKADSTTFGGQSIFGCYYVNQYAGHFGDFGTSINLTTDAVKDASSCQVASTAGLSVGKLVLIDHNTDNDPNVFWGNKNDPAGAAFNGSISGTALTINSFNTAIAGGSVAANQHVFYSGGLAGTIASGSGNNWTLQAAGPTVTGVYMESGNGTRRFFCRQDRSLSQMMKIKSIVGSTVTFETPFHITHPVSLAAQLVTSADTEVTGVGIENLYLYGGQGGDANGNIALSFCSYSWVKNVESHYSAGTGIGLYSCYRCEVRDSFMHESPDPNPGGGGYLSGMNTAAADCLFENNIMWCGDKSIVMRGTGGGNVVAYNYMDDEFGAGFPYSPEAGVNAAHFTTPHFELIEGNYTHNFKGDAFWGNSIYITVFRNWISGLRAAANLHTNFPTSTVQPATATAAAGTNTITFAQTTGVALGNNVSDQNVPASIPAGTTVIAPLTATQVTLSNNIVGAGVTIGDVIQFSFRFDANLNTYTLQQGATTYPFIDSWERTCVDIQAHSYNNNIAANVLGYSGQGAKGFAGYNQTIFSYENLGPNFDATGSFFYTYRIGVQQDPTLTFWVTGQDATILRQGNWDWMTSSQRWHGIGGPPGSGQICNIPPSYYLTSKPAFWGATAWPWVNPATGATATLPAKARFEALGVKTPIPPGNQ